MLESNSESYNLGINPENIYSDLYSRKSVGEICKNSDTAQKDQEDTEQQNEHEKIFEFDRNVDNEYNINDTSSNNIVDSVAGERIQSMSYAHAILAQNCIVMASDSRSVNEDKEGRIQHYDDGCQKVVYLPNMHVGVVTTGINAFNGKPICDILVDIDKKADNINTVLKALNLIVQTLKPLLPDGKNYTNIACGGYDDGKATMYSADMQKNEEALILKQDFMWQGGYDYSAVKLFRHYEVLPDDDKRLKEFKKDNNQNVVLESKITSVNISSVKTLIDFSDFMMQTEINRAKFIDGIPVVSSPIQTLLLTPDGEKWIHTLY